MAKDTYYFSHDYNARNDRKISALVKEFKSSGYGIYWATCEMMHEEGGKLEFDSLTIEAISKDLNEDFNTIKNVLDQCVDKYKLFIKQDILLQSNRVIRNLESKSEKKIIKAEAGRLGGIKSGESRRNGLLSKQNEALLQPASSIEANEIKGNEIKGNEIKGNDSASQFDIFLKTIENTDDFPNWASECSKFLRADEFKSSFSKLKNLPIGNLEKVMMDFILNVNSRGLFKDCAGLIAHFKNFYPKHVENKVNSPSFTHSKAFIEVPDPSDYDKMQTW